MSSDVDVWKGRVSPCGASGPLTARRSVMFYISNTVADIFQFDGTGVAQSTQDGDIWKAVYAYNHADNYVMAVLELTKKIRARVTQ